MNEITCPNCNKPFKLDNAGYADIVKQVRDHQFQEELNSRLELAQNEKNSAIELTKAELKSTFERQLAEKQQEIAALSSKIESANTQQELAITKALKEVEKQRDELVNNLKFKESEKELALRAAEEQFRNKLSVKEQTLQLKDEEIERLKDYKQKLSTKMLGETLEQHCENSFNNLRATAFPQAYFEKDNDISQGTKGDYIYREFADAEKSTELISIMFEMKNEGDETATKKKNDDFLDKLHKDREAKGCEYAILVSLLESDNDYYNNGIVDVSHRHPKMFVIRPQFFIPII